MKVISWREHQVGEMGEAGRGWTRLDVGRGATREARCVLEQRKAERELTAHNVADRGRIGEGVENKLLR